MPLFMEKVTEILARKQPHFKHISPACSVDDALCRMSSQHTDYLIVMDDNNNFLGLITEHDIASKRIFEKKPSEKTSVRDMINTNFPLADAEDTLEECMTVMRRFHIRYLPVFNDLSFMDVLSSDDILEEVLKKRTRIFD
jgi:signal-transduction protein with cAMP-binding, CBS, and nucleotidyltransferase domain